MAIRAAFSWPLMGILLGPRTHLGGVSAHLAQLNSALQARGYDTRVVSGSEFAVYAAATGTTLIERLHGSMDGSRHYMEQYPRPDVFVAHDVLAALAALQAGWKPLVLTVHGYLAREYVASGAVREGSAEWNELLAWERDAYAQSDDIVAVGRKLQGCVEELSGRSVKHLPNAIDPRPFASLPPVPMSPPFVILFAGRLTPTKGVHVLLQAAGLLETEHPELPVWWLIAGDGPQYENLKKQAESFRRVRLLGSLPHDEIPEAYARAFVVAVPSLPVAGVE
ncbi:MAG: glycosyltransferase family 4 protein, partial [Firmicutes bacterium]|nr:glycosyltransferase family 4 protein [Bacillota bacterium]